MLLCKSSNAIIYKFVSVQLYQPKQKLKIMSKDIKIRDAKIYKAIAPLKKPISDATHTITEISFLVLRIQLENGVIGESYLLSFQYSPNAIIGALKDAMPHIIGHKTNEMGIVYNKLDDLGEYFGNQGINRWAQAAVNIAMWDAWEKPYNSQFTKF